MSVKALHPSTADLGALQASCDALPDGPARRELQREIASLACDAGKGQVAVAVLETMVFEGVLVWELVDLFERVAALPGQVGQDFVIERLALHYECVGSPEDAARILKAATRAGRKTRDRAGRVRQLVKIRAGAAPSHAHLLDEVLADVAGLDDASAFACRAVLVRALRAWRVAPTDSEHDDAEDTAWRAIDRLATIYVRRSAVPTAARLLERGARLRFDRARQRMFLYRAALLHLERLRDERSAIVLFKRLFEEDAADRIARSCFEPFAALLEAGGHDAKLAWLLELRGRRVGAASAEARKDFERAGRLWERSGEPAKALQAYTRGSALGSLASLEALVRMHGESGDSDGAAAALEQLIPRAADDEKPKLTLRLAEAYFALGDVDRARNVVDELLRGAVDPPVESRARALLLELHRRTDDSRSLANLLEEEAQRNGDHGSATAALLCEAADVQRTKLFDLQASLRLLERAHHADPANAALHATLGEAFASLRMWEDVARVLADHVSSHGHRRGAELVDLRLRLARALVESGRPDDALEHLHAAARLRPADAGILLERARLERTTGDVDAAARTLRTALVAAAPELRLRIYLDLSALETQRADLARARELLESALDLVIDLGDEARGSVEDALRELGHHDLFARALDARFGLAATPARRISALDALANLWRTHLRGDDDLWLRLCGHARIVLDELARDPHSRTEVSSWEALSQICGTLGDRPMLLDVARARAAATHFMPPGKARVRVRIALAKVFGDRCERRDLELEQLTAARREDPNDAEANSLLADAFARDGRWGEAADCVERSIEIQPESTPELAPRLVSLRSAEKDEAGLARALELGLRGDPARREYLGRLLRIYEARDDSEAVLRVLLAAVSASPDDRALLARLVEAQLRAGENISCLDALDAALERDPADFELRLLRIRALERSGDIDRALADLRVYAAYGGAHPIALELARRLLVRARGMESVASEHVIGVADIFARGRSPAVAERALEDVLDRDPTNAGALQRLAALRVARGDWGRAAAAYERLIDVFDLPENDAANAAFVVAYANACLRAGAPGAAREALERALAMRPEDVTVMDQLEQTCEATSAWDRLADLLLSRAGRTHDSSMREALLLRAAEHLQRAGSPERALSLLESVCVERPESVEAALRCAEVLVALGRAGDALDLLESAHDRSRDKVAALRASVLLEKGKAHLALAQPVWALDALSTAFSLDRGNQEAALLLGIVAHDLGDVMTAERALRAVLQLSASNETSSDAQLARRLLASIGESASLEDEDTYPSPRWSELRLREAIRSAK